MALKNYRSIRNENIIEFDLALNDNAPFVAQPIIGFAGANASGKTNLLQAIRFIMWFMQNSFRYLDDGEAIPLEPFCTTPDEPTEFHIIFSQKSVIDDEERDVDYEYQVILTKKEVMMETLHYYPDDERLLAYQRDGSEVIIGESLSIPTGDIKTFTQDLRPNCSIISYAAQYPSQRIAIQCKSYFLQGNVSRVGHQELRINPEHIRWMKRHDNRYKDLQKLLRLADVGIEDLDPQDTMIIFKHRIEDTIVSFDLEQESSGTIKFLEMIYWVFSSLESGGVLVLDEIELKLHQNLIAFLIGLFGNQHENPRRTQLIFSFHNTSLIKILAPEQLWFTEKNDLGVTEIFSAADFEGIDNIGEHNLERLYQIGRFGAKPRGI